MNPTFDLYATPRTEDIFAYWFGFAYFFKFKEALIRGVFPLNYNDEVRA